MDALSDKPERNKTTNGWWFGSFFVFPFSWECHHPNWRTHIFQRGKLQPPTRKHWSGKVRHWSQNEWMMIIYPDMMVYFLVDPDIYHMSHIILPYIYNDIVSYNSTTIILLYIICNIYQYNPAIFFPQCTSKKPPQNLNTRSMPWWTLCAWIRWEIRPGVDRKRW